MKKKYGHLLKSKSIRVPRTNGLAMSDLATSGLAISMSGLATSGLATSDLATRLISLALSADPHPSFHSLQYSLACGESLGMNPGILLHALINHSLSNLPWSALSALQSFCTHTYHLS